MKKSPIYDLYDIGTTEIPWQYPFDWFYYVYHGGGRIGTVDGQGGTTSSPTTISTPQCQQDIVINSLAVSNGGNVTFLPGINGYADLIPTSGKTITVSYGGYCDIVPNANCCNNVVSYVNEYPDYQTLAPVKKDSLPPYTKSTEFDTLNAHDGIVNYPNPFQSQTIIEFSLKNDSPVSIYITDLEGKRIANLIGNTEYSKGGHGIQFNGSALAAGTYYLVFETTVDRKNFKIVKIN